MVVAVDEPRHDCHLLGIVGLGGFADQPTDVRIGPYGDEVAASNGERFCLRHARIDCIDFCVENYQIGSSAVTVLRGQPRREAKGAGNPNTSQLYESPAAVGVVSHGGSHLTRFSLDSGAR